MKETGTAFIDLWLVKLKGGEVRTLTLEALDDAFNAGFIDEDSLILPPNGTSWTRLGTAAGLDEGSASDAKESTLGGGSGTLVMALRPRRMVSPATHREATVMPRSAPASQRVVAASTRRDVPMSRRPVPTPITTRSLMGRFAALALLVLVVSFGLSSAVRYALGDTLASAPGALAVANKLGVLEPTSADVTPAPPLAVQGDEKADHHVEASPRDAQVRKDGPGRQRRSAPRRGGRTPFVNGGDRFDPMNSSL